MTTDRKDTPQPIFTSAAAWRDSIREKAEESIRTAFPFTGKKYTVNVENVRVKPAEYGPEDFKHALLSTRTLAEPIKGTLVLKDKDGKTLQRLPDFTLAQLPYYTPQHTFLVDGQPHAVNNQLRMKPGVYTRKKRNEELEAQFNTIGNPFRMTMDPETGHFHIEYRASRIPLYPVLQKLGVPDADIAQSWNPQLVTANRNKFGHNADRYFDKLYSKIVRPGEESEDKVGAVKKAFARAQLDPDVTKELLGKSFTSVTPDALLTASQKLLRAYNDKHDFDERDSLAHKRILGVDDFLAERIKLDARDIRRKVLTKLEYGEPDLERAIPSSPFTRGIKNFLNTSVLSGTPPMQINPLEIMDSAVKVTSMGEGGISSDRAVPIEARHLHGSHMGVLDPVRTPESYRAGVELRTTLFTARDKQGNIYTVLTDRSGKTTYIPLSQATKLAIAFPNQALKGKVDVIKDGRVQSVPASAVHYQVPNINSMYTLSTNLIPFLESIDGNRAEMGSKMVTQALPLKEAEPPLVQVASYRPGLSMEEELARKITSHAKTHGVVTKIKDGFIHIQGKKDKTAATERVPFFQNYPLASKTYAHDTLKVKVGDEVKPGQPLADSIYVRDGQLALGKNLQVAYAPFRGVNSNDAIVVSDSAAKKLTSLHMYREALDVDRDTKLGRETHKAYFGNKFTAENYKHLDADGMVKPGTQVLPGDPLITAVRKTTLSPDAKMLGKLHKSLVSPYRDASVVWEHQSPGVVTDVMKTGNKIRLTVKTEEPLRVGDKLANRFGAKGVVSLIIPDEQMFQDESGKPVDLVISPTSVVSRLNPAQILETAAAKVAKKTGKPLKVENFSGRDNVKWVKGLLKEHGLSDTETLIDPATGKKLKNVFVGPQYTYKMMKTTDTNFSARGVEDYDTNQQPSSGGPTGAKGLGRMEFNALVAHDARNVLKEIATLKSQKNDEWWRAHQLGLPPPPLKTVFAYDKFGAMLAGTGIKMNKTDNHIALGPLTDADITKMSAGPIQKAVFVRAKDVNPERGGFFDPVLTGGLNGTKWSHVELAEPTVNPVFERPVKTLLRMKQADFEKALHSDGGAEIRKRLGVIDLAQREKDVMAELKAARADKRDNLVKELKYVQALRESGLRPENAYVISKIPVPPPIYRPVTPGKTGDLQISDANYLLRDAMIASDLLEKTKGIPGVREDARKHLYQTVGALYGLREPTSPQLLSRGARGYLSTISGVGSPKLGFFQSSLVKRKQDISGRGTIVPDPTLAMDEIGLPEDAGWAMFSPFVIRNLVQRGYGATEAKKMVEDQHPVARDMLIAETRNRPVFINRAPSLYRYNMLAAYPKLVPGKTIRVPEALAPIQAGDFDGDAVTISAPITQAAVDEARELTLPHMLLSDQQKFTLTKAAPQQEAVLGIYKATNAKPEGKARTFETQGDALAAYHKGEITLGTPVTIRRHTTKLSSEMGILDWCGRPNDA